MAGGGGHLHLDINGWGGIGRRGQTEEVGLISSSKKGDWWGLGGGPLGQRRLVSSAGRGGLGVLPNCGTGGEGQYGRWWEGSPSSGVGKTARGVPRGWGAEGEDVHFAAGVVRDKQLHLPIPVDVLRRHTPNGAPPWLGEGHWLLASARATDWKTKQ